MLHIEKSILRKAFGLTIRSNYNLPELPVIEEMQEGTADVTIINGELSRDWSENVIQNKKYIVKVNFFMFYVPNVAIFKVENGNMITVSPFPNVKENQIRLYLLGTCMGVVLMQRGVLPLHGSVIEIDSKAYAIVGDSGAGKSTLAQALLEKGYKLLSDDIVPVSLSRNIPIVTPTYPQQKLWKESIAQFGMNESVLEPIIDRETKFIVPITDRFVAKPMQMAGIIELIKTENDQMSISKIQGLERLQTIFTHTYRNFIIKASGLMEWHFKLSTGLVNQVDFYRLNRPASSHFTAFELVDLILSAINKEE